MIALKRLAGAYMILLALAVAVHFVITPLYDAEVDDTARTVWLVLDPMMVVSAALAIAASLYRKLGLGGITTDVWEYLEANASLFASMWVFIVVLWGWVSEQWGGGGVGIIWVLVDATFIPLTGWIGCRLLSKER